MEVDGKEFLRNVGIEQDKERLTQEQQKLEELKRASVKRDQNYMDMDTEANESESAFIDLSQGNTSSEVNRRNNVEDLILDTATVNNKKKYIMLGFGLVLLFIITVLVIRLISNNDTQNKLDMENTSTPSMIKDEILNKIDSNEEYQKVIDKKNELAESKSITQKQKKEINEIVLPTQEVVDNVPLVIDTPKKKIEVKRDLFELDKKTQETQKTKPVVKPIQVKPKEKVLSKPKRTIIIPPAEETNFTQKASSLNGYFIQIGAFTKTPNKNLLQSISKKGYSYTVYQLMIKGRLYNKVLIGAYQTRKEATRKLSQVKLDFKNPNAYILKF